MALPKLVTPEFETIIPSTGQTISYRPFLVKEEKVLMIAMESGEERDLFNAGKQILNSCILTPGIEIDKLCSFDFEYLFLQLRSKSVGEVIDFKMTHKDKECQHYSEVKVNLNDVKVNTESIPENNIWLNDNIGITLRFPSISDLTQVDINNTDQVFDLLTKCVVNVFDKENLYDDFTKKELIEFLESLSQPQFQKIYGYVQSMPKLSHEVKWKCEECGEEDSYVVEGLGSFFG